MRLGASTAEAVAQVLDTYAPGLVERGEVSVLPDATDAFANLPFGAIAASVSYVDGVTGANVFVMSPNGARALAAAMMGMPPPEPEEPSEDGETPAIELTELELSAVAECANQMMAAAASAISVVLGQEVEISPPDTRVVDDTAIGDRALRDGAARHLDLVHDRRRDLPADPARPGRVRRADGSRDRRALRAGDRDRRRAARFRGSDEPGRQRAQTIGLEDALTDISAPRVGRARSHPACRSAERSNFRSAPSSTSTARPTPPWICTSTASASLKVSCSSPMTVSGQ